RGGGRAEARAFHERALVAARDDASLHAFVLASLVAVGLREGSLGEAIDIGQRAIEVAQEAGDRNMEALAAGNLGAVQATRGDLDAAASSYQHALALHRRAGNAAGVCSVLVNLGDLALGRRRLGEASRHLTEALELARQLGERRQEGVATLNLGLVELEERPQRALGRFEEAAAVFEEAGLSRLSAIAESYRGRALLRSGELEQAERVLEAVTQRFDEVGDEMQAALARGHLATVFLERGATAQAAQAWTAVQRAARALSVGEDSELGKLVAGLEGRLGGG
ncbi:MAG: tetratricopeptide repeat protein, partial [Myxococcota bacterium]